MHQLEDMIAELEGSTLTQTDLPGAIEGVLTKAEEEPAGPIDYTKELFGFAHLAGLKDANGVSRALPSYVKRSCNACYGRGFFVETKANKDRRYVACRCVNNSYARAAKTAAND